MFSGRSSVKLMSKITQSQKFLCEDLIGSQLFEARFNLLLNIKMNLIKKKKMAPEILVDTAVEPDGRSMGPPPREIHCYAASARPDFILLSH